MTFIYDARNHSMQQKLKLAVYILISILAIANRNSDGDTVSLNVKKKFDLTSFVCVVKRILNNVKLYLSSMEIR